MTTLDHSEPVLEIDGLEITFETPDGPVEAVRGVSMRVGAGETVAVVGESGSGKSQVMMAAMGLLASNGRATGAARYRGEKMIGLSKDRTRPAPRREDHHDLPGADDLARSALHHRASRSPNRSSSMAGCRRRAARARVRELLRAGADPRTRPTG